MQMQSKPFRVSFHAESEMQQHAMTAFTHPALIRVGWISFQKK